ncbi:unnamed protein product, partial [Rangifer tarandus platyrhynchus]
KPWPVETQLENILLDEDSPAKRSPNGCGAGASRHTPTTLCTEIHRGRRPLTTSQPWVHTGTEESTSGILLPHCQPILRCDCDSTPWSPRAQQPTPAQTEYLLSCPPFPHMEMRAAGAAQRRLPVSARPGVASSRLTVITLGDLLKPRPVETQLENILLDEDSPAKRSPTGCGAEAR